jgi:cold shock CspA family protein
VTDTLRRQVFQSGTGVISSFDEPRGLGTVQSSTGEELPFHCTAVTDGTRTISVGERVRFQVEPGRLGRWEATRIETG